MAKIKYFGVGILVVGGLLMWFVHSIFKAPQCNKGKCIKQLRTDENLKLSIYTSLSESPSKHDMEFVLEVNDLNLSKTLKKHVLVSGNRTIYAHIYVTLKNENPFETKIHQVARLVNRHSEFENVMRSPLLINIMSESVVFNSKAYPKVLKRNLRVVDGHYMPLLEVNDFFCDSVKVKLSSKMPLTVEFDVISYKDFIYLLLLKEFRTEYGLKEAELCSLKYVGPMFAVLLFLLFMCQTIFEFCGLKADLTFWFYKKDLIGISVTFVVCRCLSSLIVFLYLLSEDDTTSVILIPVFIEIVFQGWKLVKVLRFYCRKVDVDGKVIVLHYLPKDSLDQDTIALDNKIRNFIAILAVPACAVRIVWSLFYARNISWYKWTLNNLAAGVYGLGFISVLPQLFINYRLKSVSHMSWKAFWYRGLSNLMSVFFTFLVSMPMMHRFSHVCDGIIFFAFFVQICIYPSDTSRREPEETEEDKKEA